jgi:hypothetical protein
MRSAVQALIVALLLLLLGGVVITGTAKVSEAAERIQCANNLKAIGISYLGYKDSYGGHFPRATEPNATLPPERRLSWLVSIGPFVESTDIFVRLDRGKGWDADENRYLGLTVWKVFQCPGFADQPPASTMVPTPYIGIAGFGPDAATLPQANHRAGFFGYERKLFHADIESHTSTLLLVIESARVRDAWTTGGPATVRGLAPDDPPYIGTGRQFGGTHRRSANSLFADASVRLLADSVDPRVLEAMATIKGSATVEPADLD